MNVGDISMYIYISGLSRSLHCFTSSAALLSLTSRLLSHFPSFSGSLWCLLATTFSKVWSLRIWLCNKARVIRAEETISSVSPSVPFFSPLTQSNRRENKRRRGGMKSTAVRKLRGKSWCDERDSKMDEFRGERRRSIFFRLRGQAVSIFAQQKQRRRGSMRGPHAALWIQTAALDSLLTCQAVFLPDYRSHPEKPEHAAIRPVITQSCNKERNANTEAWSGARSLLEELIKHETGRIRCVRACHRSKSCAWTREWQGLTGRLKPAG